MKQLEHLYISGGDTKWYGHFRNSLLFFSNHILTFNLAILLLGIYPWEIKLLFMQIFIRVLFIITHKWKQLKCPSTGEWIKKPMVYPQKGILLSKKRNIYWYLTTWVNLKRICLSERNHTQKNICCIVLFIWHSKKKGKTGKRKREIGPVFASSFEWEEIWLQKGHKRQYFEVMGLGLFYIPIVVIIQLYTLL